MAGVNPCALAEIAGVGRVQVWKRFSEPNHICTQDSESVQDLSQDNPRPVFILDTFGTCEQHVRTPFGTTTVHRVPKQAHTHR
jgi:hypothetical protein